MDTNTINATYANLTGAKAEYFRRAEQAIAYKNKVESMTGKLELLEGALDGSAPPKALQSYIDRMGLSEPATLKESLYQRLLIAELRQLGIDGQDPPIP